MNAHSHPKVELREDDRPPVVVRGGVIELADGRPVAMDVLESARLVAVPVPGAAAELLPAAADPDVVADDRAALVAAAGIMIPPTLACA